MSNLQSAIEKAANAFAREIIAAVKGATLQELLAMREAPAAKKTAKASAKGKRKIAWPKCKHHGCKRNAWARGNGFCGKHFKASKKS